jgi:hypothetical protein
MQGQAHVVRSTVTVKTLQHLELRVKLQQREGPQVSHGMVLSPGLLC